MDDSNLKPEGAAADSAATPELYPDTEIAKVTPERIGEIFENENLEYRLEERAMTEGAAPETIVRTGFVNAAIALQLREKTLVIDSVWRGDVPQSQGPQILAAVNQWNEGQFAPTLRFFEASGELLAVSGFREINTELGLSRNQLGSFIMSTLDAVLQSFNFLEQQFPELVTWEEPHHER